MAMRLTLTTTRRQLRMMLRFDGWPADDATVDAVMRAGLSGKLSWTTSRLRTLDDSGIDFRRRST